MNRMQESLTLFDSICNSRWFVKTSIILFLNKIDLFAEKLQHSPLENFFPDYRSPSGRGGRASLEDEYDAACEYFLHRFVSLNQSAATKQIYAHYTCATDTQQIKCESGSQPPCGHLAVLLLKLLMLILLFKMSYSRPQRHSGYPPPITPPRNRSALSAPSVLLNVTPLLSRIHRMAAHNPTLVTH